MVNSLICSGKINLSEWESYVPSRATKAQSVERRWQRLVHNQRIRVKSLYIPLVMGAIKHWKSQRLDLALDTTMVAICFLLLLYPTKILNLALHL